MSGGRPVDPDRDAIERRVLLVRGVVQGVGFRPFVSRAATELGLSGTVANTLEGVEIDVEGPASSLDELERRVTDRPPPLARVTGVDVVRAAPRRVTGFRVVASGRGDGGVTALPPDVAVCRDCLAELFDPADRRYRYPFVTCVNCGPRFTITTALPYDRATTTMRGFELCGACRAEYDDVTDRRHHAQPLACPACGPRLALAGPTGADRQGDDALRGAQALLEQGAIVAVQGVGGFHLMCDATDAAAVAELRARKQRGPKPFAAMVADLAVAAAAAELSAPELDALGSPQAPVVLSRKRSDAPPWAHLVAPGASEVGVMLANAPVHHLLLSGLATRVLVCTSGNRADEPIATELAEALERLGSIADAWLYHDRPIHTPCDDSVLRVVRDRPVPVRRSRGWVPLPVELAPARGPGASGAVLALGGDLKGAVCVSDGRRAWLSQHLGDLATLASQRAAARAVDQLLTLTRVRPTVVAVDAHPGYLSARLGRRIAERLGVPVVTVQHHHAHIASVLAESGWYGPDTGPVIGVAFDGTGHGPDGTVWGGEVLVADAARAERAAHLAPVALVGGDATVEHPARTALAHLRAAGCAWDGAIPAVGAVPVEDRAVLAVALERSVATVATSSMGRLFDAVASLAGVCHTASYEAQAAIELQAVADPAATGAYRFGDPDAGGSIDPGPVVRAVVADVLAGCDAGTVAARFHRAVVDLVVRVACRLRDERGLSTVALSGGVFQNLWLVEGCLDGLESAGFEVLHHTAVPPNDGGLALGQALVAAALVRQD